MDEFVYFVKVVDCSGKEFIKIGKAANWTERITTMQTGCHLKMSPVKVFQTRNARKVESAIHRELDRYRFRGEWFCGDKDYDSALEAVWKALEHCEVDIMSQERMALSEKIRQAQDG